MEQPRKRSAGRPFDLGELVNRLGGTLLGRHDIVIRQVAPIDTAGPDEITYLESDAYRAALTSTQAGAVIVRPQDAVSGRACITTDQPYVYFIRVAGLLNPVASARGGIHPSAWIATDANVDPTAEIGPFTSVGTGAVIGARTLVGAGCRIGSCASIGADSHLHANVTVYDHCVVGNRAVLNAGCVVGADGFGGAMAAGRWLKMPHIGRAVLGDDVEIGANTTIDRGAMADTVIGEGAKLDNQIQIGHNVHIGRHTSIAGCAGIAGSARIGAYCVIGGGAIVLGHLSIADRVQISAGTVVTRSIDIPGRYSGIYPTSEHRVWLKGAVEVRRLGEAGAEGRKRDGSRSKSTNKADNDADQ